MQANGITVEDRKVGTVVLGWRACFSTVEIYDYMTLMTYHFSTSRTMYIFEGKIKMEKMLNVIIIYQISLMEIF